MTYSEVYEVIAMYAPAALVAFADRWSRWPDYRIGHAIITELVQQQRFWQDRDETIYNKLFGAGVTIRNHIA